MPDEVVTLKVTLDAAKDIESRLRTMDSLMDNPRPLRRMVGLPGAARIGL